MAGATERERTADGFESDMLNRFPKLLGGRLSSAERLDRPDCSSSAGRPPSRATRRLGRSGGRPRGYSASKLGQQLRQRARPGPLIVGKHVFRTIRARNFGSADGRLDDHAPALGLVQLRQVGCWNFRSNASSRRTSRASSRSKRSRIVSANAGSHRTTISMSRGGSSVVLAGSNSGQAGRCFGRRRS